MEKSSDSDLTLSLTAWPLTNHVSSLIYLTGNDWVLTRFWESSCCEDTDKRTCHNLKDLTVQWKRDEKTSVIEHGKFCSYFLECWQWEPIGVKSILDLGRERGVRIFFPENSISKLNCKAKFILTNWGTRKRKTFCMEGCLVQRQKTVKHCVLSGS